MNTKVLVVIVCSLGHSSLLFGASVQFNPGRLVTAPSVRIAPTAFALNGLRTTTIGSFSSVVPLPILNTPVLAAPAPLVRSQIPLQPSGNQAEPEARGTVLGSLSNAISLASPWGRIFDFSAEKFPGSNLPAGATPLGGAGSSKSSISDAEVRQHLDEAGHMSSSWANNDMIESYFNANNDRLNPSQVRLLLSGLKESQAYSSSKSYSRAETYYRRAASYFKIAQMTPSEAVAIAGKASASWHTNDLIEMYFTDAQMRLSWEDVKLLLAGLKDSQAYSSSKSYSRAATQDRIVRAWEKIAHRS